MNKNRNQESWTLEQLQAGYEAMAELNLALCREYEALEEEAGQTIAHNLR